MKGYTIQHSIDLLEDQVEDLQNTPTGGSTAADIEYDNTSSHLTADDVQEAIDELNTEIGDINAKTLKFGTPVSLTTEEKATLGAASGTYTFKNTGILHMLLLPGSTSAAWATMALNGINYTASAADGLTKSLDLFGNAGDTVTTSAFTNLSFSAAAEIPLEFSAPVTSTRKKTKK